MRSYYKESYYTYFETASRQLFYGKIHYGLLFFKTLKRLLIPCLFIVIVSMSPVYVPFAVVYIMYIGWSVGYFIGSLFVTYQVRGILYGVLYAMPQVLLYIPAILLLVYVGYEISDMIHKKKGLLEKVIPLAMVLTLIVVGALLETFVNSYIMQKTIFLVS